MKGKKMLQLRMMMASVIIFVVMLSIVAVNATKENESIQTVYGDQPGYQENVSAEVEHVAILQVQQHPQEAIVEEQNVVVQYNESEIEPEPLYTYEEMYAVAKVLSGECYDDELDDKRNVVWVICNRVTDGRFGDGIVGVITKKHQFAGYWHQSREMSESDLEIATEVLDAYFAGEEPAHDYLYFTGGTGKTNTFSHTW